MCTEKLPGGGLLATGPVSKSLSRAEVNYQSGSQGGPSAAGWTESACSTTGGAMEGKSHPHWGASFLENVGEKALTEAYPEPRAPYPGPGPHPGTGLPPCQGLGPRERAGAQASGSATGPPGKEAWARGSFAAPDSALWVRGRGRACAGLHRSAASSVPFHQMPLTPPSPKGDKHKFLQTPLTVLWGQNRPLPSLRITECAPWLSLTLGRAGQAFKLALSS